MILLYNHSLILLYNIEQTKFSLLYWCWSLLYQNSVREIPFILLYGSLILLYGSLILLYGSLILLYGSLILLYGSLILLYGSLILLYIEQTQSTLEWKYESALPSLKTCRADSN